MPFPMICIIEYLHCWLRIVRTMLWIKPKPWVHFCHMLQHRLQYCNPTGQTPRTQAIKMETRTSQLTYWHFLAPFSGLCCGNTICCSQVHIYNFNTVFMIMLIFLEYLHSYDNLGSPYFKEHRKDLYTILTFHE